MRKRLIVTTVTAASVVLAAPLGSAMSSTPGADRASESARDEARGHAEDARGGRAAASSDGGLRAEFDEDGRDFGAAVSNLAQSEPQAVADLVRREDGPDPWHSDARPRPSDRSGPPFGRGPWSEGDRDD